MRIRKLEIYGFKTFPQPTELTFHDGITAIVGPNGCGKSNIIDAIRWVMGEKSAKGLRGDSMEDVIFSGCESRRALNFAEVTLTLTEVEGALPEKFGKLNEVAVTRRLHRDGESEYYINKIPCRLKDIADLFLDTGLGKKAYSIVEQGKIDAILSSKPIDRRYLIEEAAGLSKYRARREEALTKIKSTSENLERVNDIIGEVKRDLNSLKRQATKAKAYKTLKAEKRELERNLLVSHFIKISEDFEAALKLKETISSELEASIVASDRMGADLVSHRTELLEREKAIEEHHRHVYGIKNQIGEREHRLKFLDQETAGLVQRSQRAQKESEDLLARAGEIAGQIEKALADREEYLARAKKHEEELAAAEASHAEALAQKRAREAGMEEHRKVLFGAMQEQTKLNNALEHSLRMDRQAKTRHQSVASQIEEVSQKIKDVGGEVSARKNDLGAAQAALEQAKNEKARLEEDLEDLTFERDHNAKKVADLSKRLQTEQASLKGLTSLKDSLEWYGKGVKSYLKHAKDQKIVGVRGVVADAISVPPRFEAALEAALGERLEYVVVADSAQAVEGVSYLKQSSAGRSSFVPVDLKSYREEKLPNVSEEWSHGPLLNLVDVTPGHERMAKVLLGGYYVVDNLKNAIDLWTRNGTTATFVTLDGETLSPEGVVTGGAMAPADSGLLSRNRKIRDLQASVSKLVVELSAAEDIAREVNERYSDAKKRLEYVRDEAHRQELKVAHVSKDMAQFIERSERLNERLMGLALERDNLNNDIQKISDETSKLEKSRADVVAAIEEAQAKGAELKKDYDEAQRAVDALNAEVGKLRVALAEDRQRTEGIYKHVAALNQNKANYAERSNALKADAKDQLDHHAKLMDERKRVIAEIEVLTAELGRREEAARKHLAELDEKRAFVNDREKGAGEARKLSEEIRKRLSDAEFKASDLKMNLEAISVRFNERLHADIAEAVTQGVPEGFDQESSKSRIQKLDEELNTFGELNLLADEEYEERKARFDFLDAQKKDLESSIDSLKEAITRINRISRERFGETFEAVNAKFKEIYPVLFRGGEATLLLTDPENLLETGIDIIAKPPGKRPQHISLLSGGEKALTAVALIFSLFMVKPSPFCILDEVDAPLDDANVEHFTKLLMQMADNSQFLVITHNKITMEAGSHLYGVTMEEPGISNLVSVRLESDLHTQAVA